MTFQHRSHAYRHGPILALAMSALACVLAACGPPASTSVPSATAPVAPTTSAVASEAAAPTPGVTTEPPSAPPSAPPSQAAVPADWETYPLTDIGAQISLPPEWIVLDAGVLGDPARLEALKERFPENGDLIDQFKEQLEQGALLLVAADGREGRSSGGIGSQITIGRYPNPIAAGAQQFTELVAGTLTEQVEELGPAEVSVVQLPLGEAGRLELSYTATVGSGTVPVHVIQYPVANGGLSFYVGYASGEEPGETSDLFDEMLTTLRPLS